MTFSEEFELLEDLTRGQLRTAVSVRKAVQKRDGKVFCVKIVCTLGMASKFKQLLAFEADFWRRVSHQRVLSATQVIETEGFTYFLYEYPEGGNLLGLLSMGRVFTEAIVRIVASAILSALQWCHANGIIHGHIEPVNVVFRVATAVPGWINSAQLAFFAESAGDSVHATAATDCKALAGMLAGMLLHSKAFTEAEQQAFDPLSTADGDWRHLSAAARSFIVQLYSASDGGADEMLRHPWFESATKEEEILKENAKRVTAMAESNSHANDTVFGGWLWKKDVMRDALNRRQWKQFYCELKGSTLFFSAIPPRATSEETADEHMVTSPSSTGSRRTFSSLLQTSSRTEPSTTDMPLPTAISVRGMQVIEVPSRHEFTFAVHDPTDQRILVYLRCKDKFQKSRWWDTISSAADASVPSNQLLALNTAMNFLSPAFASNLATETRIEIDAAGKLTYSILDKHDQLQTDMYQHKRNGHNDQLPMRRRGTDASIVMDVDIRFAPTLPESTEHPALHWEHRAAELVRVLRTGVPCTAVVEVGKQWYIIGAQWFKQWLQFVSSERRVSPPGMIDNLWMLNPATQRPFASLIEDTDTRNGDFRRVTKAIWEIFAELYGGGPAMYVVGPPIEDTTRWVIANIDGEILSAGADPAALLGEHRVSEGSTVPAKELSESPSTKSRVAVREIDAFLETRQSGLSDSDEDVDLEAENEHLHLGSEARESLDDTAAILRSHETFDDEKSTRRSGSASEAATTTRCSGSASSEKAEDTTTTRRSQSDLRTKDEDTTASRQSERMSHSMLDDAATTRRSEKISHEKLGFASVTSRSKSDAGDKPITVDSVKSAQSLDGDKRQSNKVRALQARALARNTRK